MASKTTQEEMVAVARKIEGAIKSGVARYSIEWSRTYIAIELSPTERITVFNDAGSADYIDTIKLGDRTLQYGEDYETNWTEVDPDYVRLPIDPLNLVEPAIFKAIDKICEENQ